MSEEYLFIIWLIGCGVTAGLLTALRKVFNLDQDLELVAAAIAPLWPLALFMLAVLTPIALIAFVVYRAILFVNKVFTK